MNMRIDTRAPRFVVAIYVATLVACAQQGGEDAAGIALDPDDIGGTVTSTAGPEAGVCVVA